MDVDVIDSAEQLSEALAALGRGWTLVALRGRGPDTKPSRKKWWAITTQEEVRRHLADGGNFGVWTNRSGVVVIDIDPRNGGELSDRSRYPETLTAESGRGGLHLIFRAPSGVKLRGKELNDDGTKRPGIDVISAGYIVMVPGYNETGEGWYPEPCEYITGSRRYRWLNDLPLADLDADSLVRLAKNTPQRRVSIQDEPAAATGTVPTTVRPETPTRGALADEPDEFEDGPDFISADQRRALNRYVQNAPEDDSDRDYYIAGRMRWWGLSEDVFIRFIGTLDRRKKDKAHNRAYLRETWNKAKPIPEPEVVPPSQEDLLSLSSLLPPSVLDVGNRARNTSSEGVARPLDPREEKSRRLIVGYLIWKLRLLNDRRFRLARREIARATGRTDKTVGKCLHKLHDLELIHLGSGYSAGNDGRPAQPRWIDTSGIILHLPDRDRYLKAPTPWEIDSESAGGPPQD